jgi:hypothetical protein
MHEDRTIQYVYLVYKNTEFQVTMDSRLQTHVTARKRKTETQTFKYLERAIRVRLVLRLPSLSLLLLDRHQVLTALVFRFSVLFFRSFVFVSTFSN